MELVKVLKDQLGFSIIFVFYIALMIADITTTLMNDSAHGLETNILYLWTGSFWPIILLNLVYVWLFYWMYFRRGEHSMARFFVLNTMVVMCVARLFAIKQALFWLNNPGLAVQAAQTATVVVKLETQKILGLIIYAPIFLPLVSFWGFKKDHYIYRKDIKE